MAPTSHGIFFDEKQGLEFTGTDVLSLLRDLQDSHESRIAVMLERFQEQTLQAVREAFTFSEKDSSRRVKVQGVGAKDSLESEAREVQPPGQRIRPSFAEVRKSEMRGRGRSDSLKSGLSQSIRKETVMRFRDRKKHFEEVHAFAVAEPDARIAGEDSSRASNCRVMVQRIAASRVFEILVTILILVNSFFLGSQVDWQMRNIGQKEPISFQIGDVLFTAVFTVELSVRLIAQGIDFWTPSNRTFAWNMFDTALVLSSLINVLITSIRAEKGTDLAAIRLLRVLKLMRVLRVVRVLRFFSDLRILVASVGSSMKSLMWALILHFILEFIIGVVIMDFTSQHLEETQHVNATYKADIIEYFGTIARSLSTLFMAMNGGMEWGLVARPLVEVGPWLGLFFALYIAISVFCVLNIITGLFVENAKKMTQMDDLHLFMESLESRKAFLNNIELMFSRIADPGVDYFTVDNLRERIKDVHLQSKFARFGLDIEVENAPGLFQLLDFNNDGCVDLDEFALGVQMLHGHARSIDVARLRHNSNTILRELHGLRSALIDYHTEDETECEPPGPPSRVSSFYTEPPTGVEVPNSGVRL